MRPPGSSLIKSGGMLLFAGMTSTLFVFLSPHCLPVSSEEMAAARLAPWIAHFNRLADADGPVVRARLFQARR